MRHVFTVDTHTMGEPTRIVVGGLPVIPGRSIAERQQYLSTHMDDFRRSLLHEPRGHRDMFGAVLTQPVDPDATLGVIFMDSGGYLPMCGHGTIGVVTTALELGWVPFGGSKVPPVVLETPAGLVSAVARRGDRGDIQVTFRNVPAFVSAQHLAVVVEPWGTLPVTVAYGGSFFALVRSEDLGLPLHLDYLPELIRAGLSVRDAVNSRFTFRHPTQPDITGVRLTEITAAGAAGADGLRNVVVFGHGSVDRSPCGTGLCAKMAALHAAGDLPVGREIVSEGILGTSFQGRLVEEVTIGGTPAVVPEVTGAAFITGYHHFVIDPADPLAGGFLLRDPAGRERGEGR